MSIDRAQLLRLRADVQRDLATAGVVLADLVGRRDAIARGDDPVLLGYAAITLHQLYTALETAFERICRGLEGSLPVGADSHRALLHDMTLDLPGLRPPVLRSTTADALGALLRFRHFVRHAYAVAWDSKRLIDVLDGCRAVWSDVCADIDGFVAFITDVLDALEDD